MKFPLEIQQDRMGHPVPDLYADLCARLTYDAAGHARRIGDVSYGEDVSQKLDIWLPKTVDPVDAPVLILIHGGIWVYGSRTWMGFSALPLVDLPAIVVTISYRLAPQHVFPAAVEDCFSALAWVRGNIRRYGGDPDRIFVGGHSAGGHLSATLTLRKDWYDRYDLPDDVVKACFPLCGLYDMLIDGSDEPHQVWWTKFMLPDIADAVEASPIHHLDGNKTPFLIAWAENDIPEIVAQSPRFADAASQQSGRVETLYLPHFDHYYAHLDTIRAESPWVRTVRAWMGGDPQSALAYGPDSPL